MDISKIFLEEKLFENGFSELIKSADEAQSAKLPSHISIHSEVSLDKAFSVGTRSSELHPSLTPSRSPYILLGNDGNIVSKQMYNSKTYHGDSRSTEVSSNRSDELTSPNSNRVCSSSNAQCSKVLTTSAETSSFIILIVRIDNEFVLNINGVVSPQEYLDDPDIAALLEIYRCGVAEWYSEQQFSIGSIIDSDTLTGLGVDFSVTRFPRESTDDYLVRASMFILTSPELACPDMAPETTWTLWANACFESPMHFLVYVYTHTTYYYSWFNVDGDLIQPQTRADWDLITFNYSRRSLLYYDTKFSTADIDMMFEERDEVIRQLRIQNQVMQKQFNHRFTPGLHRALECVRVYARARPLTLDERIAAILDLADTSRGMFDFVLLQLHRQAILKTLIHADLTATAPIHSTAHVMPTNHHTREQGTPDLTTSLEQELKHLVSPLLLSGITLTMTEIDSISETASGSLIRH